MSRTAVPCVRRDVLTIDEGKHGSSLLHVGSGEWYEWLTSDCCNSFSYVCDAGRFTARKETKQNNQYWYAYRRAGGRLYKSYLGKAEKLTPGSLRCHAANLSSRIRDRMAVELIKSLGVADPKPSSEAGDVIDKPAVDHFPLALLGRPRLMKKLKVGSRHKLTLIQAPAGYGKTVAIRQFVSDIEKPFAWCSLDEGCNEILTFARTLLRAIHRTGGTSDGSSIEPSAKKRLIDPDCVVELLIREMRSLQHEMLLVLDDYSILESVGIRNLVCQVIKRLPPGVNSVLTSRSTPSLPLPLMRSRDELCEISARELSFTSQETAGFMEMVSHVDLSRGEIAVFQERTEGWPAGLRLATLAMQDEEDVPGFIRGLENGHRFFTDYFSDEVFLRYDEEVQEFLMETSIMKDLSCSSCDYLTSRENSDEILKLLEGNNAFLFPLDGNRKSFRYHNLFSGFLRERLEMTFPGKAEELHRKAARWYVDRRQVLQAVEHLFAGRDYKRATRLMQPLVEHMLTHDEHTSLARWLGELPNETLFRNPQLCVWYACTLAMSDMTPAHERPLEEAEKAWQSGSDREKLGKALSIHSHVASLRGDRARAIELAEKAMTMLPVGDVLHRSLCTLFLGEAELLSGNAVAAFRWLNEAASLAETQDLPLVAQLATAVWGHVSLMEGTLERASEAFNRVIAGSSDLAYRPAKLIAYLGLGDLCAERNDLNGATRYLDKVLAEEQLDLLKAYARCNLARVSIAKGGLDEAEFQCDEALDCRGLWKEEWLMGQITALKARIWICRGDLSRAVEYVDSSGVNGSDSPTYEEESFVLTRSRIRILQGRANEAMPLLRQVSEAARIAGRGRTEMNSMVLQALAHQSLKRHDSALTVMEELLSAGEREGYVRLFLDEGGKMARLLECAVIEGVCADYASLLLSLLELDSGRPEISVGLDDSLTRQEREVLKLISTGASYAEIADSLFITKNTVKKHVSNILRKLEASNRVQALVNARRLGLI